MRYSNLFYKPHPPLRGPPVSPAGSGTSGSDSSPNCHSKPSVSLRYPKGKVYSLSVLSISVSLRYPKGKVKCYAFSVPLSRLSSPLTFLGGRRAPALRVCAKFHFISLFNHHICKANISSIFDGFHRVVISSDLSDFTVWSICDTPPPPYRLCLIISFFFVLLILREESPSQYVLYLFLAFE